MISVNGIEVSPGAPRGTIVIMDTVTDEERKYVADAEEASAMRFPDMDCTDMRGLMINGFAGERLGIYLGEKKRHD
jgi:hypothetical protein